MATDYDGIAHPLLHCTDRLTKLSQIVSAIWNRKGSICHECGWKGWKCANSVDRSDACFLPKLLDWKQFPQPILLLECFAPRNREKVRPCQPCLIDRVLAWLEKQMTREGWTHKRWFSHHDDVLFYPLPQGWQAKEVEENGEEKQLKEAAAEKGKHPFHATTFSHGGDRGVKQSPVFSNLVKSYMATVISIYRVFFTRPAQKSSKYGTGPTQ